MICDVCQSDRLAKNDLGFLICDDCGAQSFAATQEESEFLMGEAGARALQRIRKSRSTDTNPKDTIASLSTILKTIQATLFIQCCAASNHFGTKRSLLLETAGDLFLAYFESARRDYDGKFEIILTVPGLPHHAQSNGGQLPPFKVQQFITIHILALALNLMREPITPLDLCVQIRLGNIPTQDAAQLLPPEISSTLTVRLYQFLSQRATTVTPGAITKEMKSIYDRVCRVTSLPELRPVSGNIPLTLTRYVVQLQLPVETVAPLSHALLGLYTRKVPTVSRSHTIAAVVLAVKLLYGSRSPSPLDSVLSSLSLVPFSKLCSAPDPDSADFAAIRKFTRLFHDYAIYSQRTKLAVGDAFDAIYSVPPPEELWDPIDCLVSRPYDDFVIADDDRCLCWYKDPARGGDRKPINVNQRCFLKSGGNRDDCPEYRRLVYYDSDEMHNGHCIEHYLHRRLFQAVSDLFDISQRDLDLAYRQIVESIYKQYPSRLVEVTESAKTPRIQQMVQLNRRRRREKIAYGKCERKRLKSMLPADVKLPRNGSDRCTTLDTLRTVVAQQTYLRSCMSSLTTI